ncbi:hypothetical protein V1477_016955 [Vespula maculifrons]|uniref:Uncharacterized protein n=1 Tax=Vespula maculifrons TaxID=7453 RepID=A0ABD2B4L7_VESMC
MVTVIDQTDGFSRLLGIVRIDEHTAATDATTATATSATSERNRNYLGTVTSKAAANCGWWIEGFVLSRLPLLIPLRSLPHWTKKISLTFTQKFNDINLYYPIEKEDVYKARKFSFDIKGTIQFFLSSSFLCPTSVSNTSHIPLPFHPYTRLLPSFHPASYYLYPPLEAITYAKRRKSNARLDASTRSSRSTMAGGWRAPRLWSLIPAERSRVKRDKDGIRSGCCKRNTLRGRWRRGESGVPWWKGREKSRGWRKNILLDDFTLRTVMRNPSASIGVLLHSSNEMKFATPMVKSAAFGYADPILPRTEL